jgi:hypothetical protein
MIAGWVSHPLGNAALSRRTHIPVVALDSAQLLKSAKLDLWPISQFEVIQKLLVIEFLG